MVRLKISGRGRVCGGWDESWEYALGCELYSPQRCWRNNAVSRVYCIGVRMGRSLELSQRRHARTDFDVIWQLLILEKHWAMMQISRVVPLLTERQQRCVASSFETLRPAAIHATLLGPSSRRKPRQVLFSRLDTWLGPSMEPIRVRKCPSIKPN